MLSMMSGYRTLLPLVALALSVGFGSAAAETAGKAELPPGEWRTFKVGDKWVWRNQDGREYTREIVALEGNVATIATEGGKCRVKARLDGYARSLAWENCSWGAWGRQSVSRNGNMWPLKVGNTETWDYEGGTGSRTWSGTRSCEVKEAVKITVPAGSFDTWHVLCTERWWRNQFYFSPKLGTTIAIVRTPLGRGSFSHLKLVRFIPAG